MNRKKFYCLALFGLSVSFALSGCLMVGCTKRNQENSPDASAVEYNKRLDASAELAKAPIDASEIFHDQADVFMSPLEPKDTDNVTIRLRVRRGAATKVTLQFTVDLNGIADDTAVWNDIPMLFEIADETMYYDYWICVIPAQTSPYKYQFKVENEADTVYYNAFESARAEGEECPLDRGGGFYVMPNFSTPDWAKGCIWYSIMPDTFFNGDPLNDKTTSSIFKEDVWGTTHTAGDYSAGLSYFGGDLAGVYEKLEYIKELNATGVFVNPIWFAYHNAGYGAADMTQIDSCFGNDNLLTALADALHENDMKLMLDGVFTYFTYVGTWYNSSNYYPLEGAVSPEDKYYEVYIRDANGNPTIVWGNPRVDFSDKLARELVYSTPTSVMQYYLLRHGIDGWRLDVGSDLTGSDPSNWGNATQIIQDMRRYLKDIDEDMLLCSEGGSGTMLTDYALDTMWNFDYYYSVQDFLTQSTSESTVWNLNSNLYGTICNLPKPVANCSYNFTANHDMPRALNASGGDVAKVMGATIVNFTFVGAPCIYFGEEIGMDSSPFSDSMIWDKSQWNYEIYNLYRALTSLRSEFAEVYKDGTIKDLNMSDESGMLAFARWKGNDKTVTVMNPFDDVRTAVLDVHCLELKDGTVLTDYLSGRRYTIKDGKVTVRVGKGGVVLVNREVNGWAGKYELSPVGNASAYIYESGTDALTLEGSGALSDVSDEIVFANLPVFNNGGISFKTSFGGAWAALIRDDNLSSDGAFYGVLFDASGKGTVIYRARKGESVKTGATVELAEGTTVSVERLSGNRFVLLVTADGEKQILDGSEKYVAMDYYAFAGVCPIDGKTELSEISVYLTAEQLATDFSSTSDPMSFLYGDAEKISVSDGLLTIEGGEGVNAYLAPAHVTDFTVKTLLKSTPSSGSQGVAVWQSENNYILLGRTVIDGGKKLALMQYINGDASVVAASDDVSGDVTLQLEKVGFYYTGKYSTDGVTFATLGENLLANYSELYAGVVNASGSAAAFDYFCFGDAINDGRSTADHQYYGALGYYSEQKGFVSGVVTQSVAGGKWDYCLGGLQQTLPSVTEGILTLGNVVFNGFKADFTLQITETGSAEAYVEYRFGQTESKEYGAVRLAADGCVSLLWAENVLCSYTIAGFDMQTQYRFLAVMNQEKKISVFMNEFPKLLMERTVPAYSGGTHTVVCHKCAFEITSFNVYHYYMDWLHMNGYFVAPTDNYIILTSNGASGNAALLSAGVSDVIIGANVRMQKTLNTRTAEFGYLFNALAGKLPSDGGIFVGVTDKGLVTVSEAGNVLAEKTVDFDYESFYLIVAVQGGRISVYVDKYVSGDENGVAAPSSEPVLTYDAGKALGGSVQLYTSYSKVILANCAVYGLRPGENYKALELFRNRTIESPVVKTPARTDAFETAGSSTLSWDFSDKRQIEDFTSYEGAWYVDAENRRLVGLGTGDWLTGVTVNAGKFTNYELKYKIYCHSAGAWAGVLLNKTSWKDNHDDGGYLFYTNTSGNGVYFAQGGLVGSGALDEDGYLSVTIKVYGTEEDKYISVTVGGVMQTLKIGRDTSTYMTGGYVSIVAGNCVAYFRDISLRQLDEAGNYVS